PYIVIGVVDDFHFESMHTPIKPLIIQMTTQDARNLIVRLDPTKHSEAISDIRVKWNNLFDGKSLNFSYVADNYNKLYNSEEGMSKGFMLLTVIAIFIACLGLVGLATHSTSQKTREIGVRKVMGANTLSLLFMLWWNFVRLVGISILIAWPIAFFLVKDWLNNFAYRVNISPWVFILSGVVGVLLALISVATITYSAARQNPAESLKWE
ncbi:MAG: cell division protein FtsX, partial [Bacteroidetes bacterium HGW-Bacteroidetes-15]